MNKTQYFYRTAVFSRRNDEVTLIDLKDPEGSPPLETWLGSVVTLADGQHTLDDMFQYISAQYRTGAPDNLDETLKSIVDRLKDTGVIRFADKKVTLPYYLDVPYEQQDLKKAKELMIKDGFIRKEDLDS